MLRSLSLLLAVLVIACSGGEATPERTSTASPLPPTQPPATTTPLPTPTPVVVRQDIRATRLVIPKLAIDAPVQDSRTIPDTSAPPPGCPPKPEGQETLTVPAQGIATPVDNLEGFENKAWIFGHSRWLGNAGVLFTLQDLDRGDEVIVEGVDRATGAPVEQRRFVVDGLYLTDTQSGEELISATTPADIPALPTVILQTSVREDGAGKQWILDRDKLEAKATNLVQGDINDICKYLLLFVIARQAG